MRQAAAVLLLLVAGCHSAPPAPGKGDTPGDRLEAAAIARGIVTDPARTDPTGLYAREGDRICVSPASGGGYRVGALVRYDDGQGCAASGSARLRGSRLNIRLADDCRFAAVADDESIRIPALLPVGCDRFCTGRASLSALAAERLSTVAAEAAALRDGHGRALCGEGNQ